MPAEDGALALIQKHYFRDGMCAASLMFLGRSERGNAHVRIPL